MGLFSKKVKLDDKTMRNGAPLIVLADPSSAVAEEFRTVTTNIKFAIIGNKDKTISVTSSNPSEGKSFFVANLAITFANQNERTLLIDADLRRSTVHRTFMVSNKSGLSNLLSDDLDSSEVIQHTNIKNLDVITSGPIPPNPAELIGSQEFEKLLADVNSKYDRIIVDTPPVNCATDASLIASNCYGTILVVPQGIADKNSFEHALQQLNQVHAKILGFVMNRSEIKKSAGYGGYYGVNGK